MTVLRIVLRTFSFGENRAEMLLEFSRKISYLLELLICLFPAFSFVEVLDIEKDFLNKIRNCV